MNYTYTENPSLDKSITVINTNGVMTSAKIAKLNNSTKRPAVLNRWLLGKPKEEVTITETPKEDFSSLIESGSDAITPVNYSMVVEKVGAKKLRVNPIVKEKTSGFYTKAEKINIVPTVKEEPKVEPEEVKTNPLEPSFIGSRIERGRHENTGEVPVSEIKEAVANDTPSVDNVSPLMATRSERLSVAEAKPESKGGDMNLYNKLVHADDDNFSHQLQGARKQLLEKEEENKKLTEQIVAANEEIRKLEEANKNIRLKKQQKDQEELNKTLNRVTELDRDNLEKTSDLSSLQDEIARLRAEKQAIEESLYEDSGYHMAA